MEAIATGATANLASETAKAIFPDIKRHVRYIFIHKKNVEKFEKKMELLIAKRRSIQLAVALAKNNVETIKPDVELWCKLADKTIDEEVKKVKDLEEKAKAKCFIGLCPNIKSRYQLSRKAEDVLKVVDELLQDGKFVEVALPAVLKASTSAALENFKAFDSRKGVFDKIMEALNEPSINIGVYGPGGVGKTTLVDEVTRQGKEVMSFSSMVKATVTLTPNIEEIQCQIAESLGLKLEEKSIQVRASRLSERLKNEENILVVLDDLWAPLSLDEVGIPFGHQHKGCKILLISRDENVLNKMDVERTFEISVLKGVEAWELFKKMAGNNFEDPELKSVATEVATRCGGLPLAIVTIARALRKKALHEWKDTSRQLQRPSPGNFTGIPAVVYLAIELSYNHLENEELRQTFLLSCLLGRNAHIEDLLRWAKGLHLFDGVNTVDETRNRVLTMVSNLKASCLLTNGYDKDHFSMHDIVHDVALAIASRDNHAIVLKDRLDKERIETSKMISLSLSTTKKLPHELDCPQLILLAMGSSSKDFCFEMRTSFFEKMRNIKVLDLIQMSVSSSIGLPTSLRTLCLKRCMLRDTVNLGKLKNLEILCLSGSMIKMLHEEIGQLKWLRLLDLSCCTKLKIIPHGVLSSLSSLEELYMSYVDFPWNEPSNASLDELKELTGLHIKIPDASIVPKDLFSEKLERCQILIGKEWNWDDKFEYLRTLKLKVNIESINHLDDGFKCLLKKTEALYLTNLEGFKIVLNEVGYMECFPDLKHLCIGHAWGIQYIMIDKIAFPQLRSLALENLPELISFCSRNEPKGSTSVSQHELPLFGEQMELPLLENLHLSSINIGRIWHNFTDHKSITSLVIDGCPNLKYIFSSSMARSLENLKSFEISKCPSLREIMFTEQIEEEKNVTIEFPQLRTLTMRNLEHLIGFCSENYNLGFPSLKSLRIWYCPIFEGLIYKSTTDQEIQPLSIQALFNEKVVCSNLVRLELSSTNVERMWDDQQSEVCCSVQNLERVTVVNCHNLICLFSSPMLRFFKQLRYIAIEYCENIEEVIFMEGAAEEDKVGNEILTELGELHLRSLPKLMAFCHFHGSYLEFPSLFCLLICDCPTLKTFISDSLTANEKAKGYNFNIDFPSLFNEKVTFPNLEELILNIDSMRKIWHGQLQAGVFPKVKFLQLQCSRDTSAISAHCFNQRFLQLEGFRDTLATFAHCFNQLFPNLQDFRLHDSDFSQIFNLDGVGDNEIDGLALTFSKLRSIVVGGCSILETLVPSSVSFENLTMLRVFRCDKLVKLIAFSAAKSLVQLTRMSIANCKMIEEIIAGEGDEVKGCIVFTKLKFLELKCLPSLSSFCSRDHDFEFPALEKMIVMQCPKMEDFCQGEVSTTQLSKVMLTDYGKGWRWEGNLQTTIQRMFEEMKQDPLLIRPSSHPLLIALFLMLLLRPLFRLLTHLPGDTTAVASDP